MAWSDYWGALGSRQRTGLLFGAIVVAGAMLLAAFWLLNDPYVAVETHLGADRLGEITQQLDRAKLGYRVSEDGDAVLVPQSMVGKARAAAAVGLAAVPPGVGLELFKETDFSSTDFAQRINYQRALQGELTRTIQAISGVRSVRVHVILADAGLFKRESAKASAAVSVAMQPGKTLTRAQVRGIQRLAAASIPEIRIDDVVVLDEAGTSLTAPSGGVDGDASSAQLDMKRQVDQYLEGKLQRLLQDLVPQGLASLSVDAQLDDRQLRVTTEEPLAAAGEKDADRPTGIATKERQSQHSHAPAAGPDASAPDSTEWEFEYKVGHRMEQILSSPGSVKRVNVAVVLQGAPSTLTNAAVEQLVAHAVGVDPSRGDSVDVLLLPGPVAGAVGALPSVPQPTHAASSRMSGTSESSTVQGQVIGWLSFLLLAAVALAALLGWQASRRRTVEASASPDAADVEATVAKVRHWLSEGEARAHG